MTTQDSHDQTTNHGEDVIAPLTVNAQYLKDVTFENPNPISFLHNTSQSPEINVNVDVRLEKVADKTFEVCLHIGATAERDKEKLFVIEVDYAGVFTLGNLPEEAIQPVLMIECPRILFPYARQIIANLTREGGYPALALNPIDFVEMYRQQVEYHQQNKVETDA